MSVFRRGNGGNDAVQVNGASVNGQAAAETINYQGSDWYWTVCACMTFATIVFIGLSTRKARSDRIFHYITAGITMVASIAYFTMASNLGWVSILVEFDHSPYNGPTREIFYVRYIDWFITTPLLLMDLLLTAGMPWPTVLWVILVDWVMVVTGLVGALVSSSYKWGYYTFGCVALFYIIYVLAIEARRSANALGKDVGRVFLYTGSLTALLWLLYPIAWGVCEGGNVISTDGEAGFYGALDLFAKPVFGAILLWGHKDIDPARLGLAIKDYTANDASVRTGEKHNGVTGHHTDNTVVGNNTVAPTTANNTAEATV